MKKTLLLTGMFLLAGLTDAMADAVEDAATLDIKDVAAQTYEDVTWTSQTSGGTMTDGGKGSFMGFIFKLSKDNPRLTTTATPAGGSRTAVQALTEIQIQFRNDTGTNDFEGGERLIITDESGKIYGISSAVSGSLATASAWLTFSFGEDGIQLFSNNTYHAHFVDSSFDVTKTTFASGEDVKRGMRLMKYSDSSTSGMLVGVTTDHSEPHTDYAPVVKITTKNIPEPASATLSLLALAGLAARRRRK